MVISQERRCQLGALRALRPWWWWGGRGLRHGFLERGAPGQPHTLAQRSQDCHPLKGRRVWGLSLGSLLCGWPWPKAPRQPGPCAGRAWWATSECVCVCVCTHTACLLVTHTLASRRGPAVTRSSSLLACVLVAWGLAPSRALGSLTTAPTPARSRTAAPLPAASWAELFIQ